MDRTHVLQRIRQLQDALEADPLTLETSNSPESARSVSSLAYLPYLTINDIIVLRDAGMTSLDEIKEGILEVPEAAWPHVLDLVRSRVLEINPGHLEAPAETNGAAGGNPQCLALTKQGTRCRNPAREGSTYCASHKGYQPTEAELKARRSGLIG